MYNSIIGTSFTSSYLQFTNNFYAEWQVDKNWKATARIGVSEKRNDMDDFYPASHSILQMLMIYLSVVSILWKW